MAEQPWSSVKQITIGLRGSVNVFSGVNNHALPSGSQMDQSGFGEHCLLKCIVPTAKLNQGGKQFSGAVFHDMVKGHFNAPVME